ncbi:conserved membrane hypothetical protein [[Clostridium] ultunense Esp]|nr:conserved membrane hypothetical protein [[Clostridium] ultunense Esp]
MNHKDEGELSSSFFLWWYAKLFPFYSFVQFLNNGLFGRDEIKMRTNVKAIVEGALMAALFLLLLFLVLYTPLGTIGFIVLPLPFVLYTARNKVKNSLLLGFVAILLMIPFGLIALFPLTLYSWWIGLVLGWSFFKKNHPLLTLTYTFLATLLYLLLALLFASLLFKIDLVGELITLLKETMKETSVLMGDALQNQLPSGFMETFLQEFRLRFPALLILYSFFSAFIIQYISGKLFRRLGGETAPFPPFSELRFPRSILYYFLASLLLLLIPNLQEMGWLHLATVNIFTVLYLLITLEGLFFLFYYAKEKKLGRWLPVAGFVMLFLPPLDTILRVIGILDLGFPLRNKKGQG